MPQQSPIQWLTEQLPIRIQNMYSQEIGKALQLEKARALELYVQGQLDRENNIFKAPAHDQ